MKYLSVILESRGATCAARLLEDEAPRTAQAVWDAPPLSGQAYRGKYARNEIYAVLPAFAWAGRGPENTTIASIPGDPCWFSLSGDQLCNSGYGYASKEGASGEPAIADLALFYSRNSLLLNGDQGRVPGNTFASVVSGLDEVVTAWQGGWIDGARGETLAFARVEGPEA